MHHVNTRGGHIRHRTTRVAGLLGAVAVLAAIATPAAANASNWGPLTVTVDHNIAGDAYGTASVTTVHVKNAATWNGTIGDPTRVETSWYFYETNRQADGTYISSWTYENRSDTATRNKTSYTTQTVQYPLDDSWDKVRAEPRICSPRPWGTPVPCLSTAIKTFSY